MTVPVFQSTSLGRRQRPRAAAAPSNPTDVAGRTLNDIHAELGARLSSYGVFPPRRNDAFDLFQVLYIHSDPHTRHHSPKVTQANLKEICDAMKEDLDDGENIPLNQAALKKISRQMNHTVTTNAEDAQYAVVTDSSLQTSRTAAASVNVPDVVDAGFNLSRDKIATRAISVTVTESKKCTRVTELRKLIWRNGDVLFGQILEHLDRDLEMASDARKLIAIVTHKIVADVSIANERSSTSKQTAHAGGPVVPFDARVEFEKIHQQAGSTAVGRGIAGIQFIVFPVKRLGAYKFRVLPGLNVGNVYDDGLGEDTFSKYKRWQKGEDVPKDNLDNGYRDVPFNTLHLHCGDDCLQKRPRSAPGPETSGIPNAGAFRHIGSKDDLNGPDWIEVEPRLNSNRVPFIDVDLAPSLTDFAMRQCTLAARYRARADRDTTSQDETNVTARRNQRAKSISLLRSALRKCCYESTVRALSDLAECYHSGIGIAQETDTASGVRHCARVLGQVHESQRIWFQLLADKNCFLREPEPEKRILQMISISGPRPRLGFCLASNTVTAMPSPDEMESSSPIIPEKGTGEDGLSTRYFGEMIGEVMLKYLVRKLFRINSSKSSKKLNGGTMMERLYSAVDKFQRFVKLQQNESTELRDATGAAELPLPPRSVIPNQLTRGPHYDVAAPATGTRHSEITASATSSRRSFPMITVLFTLGEKRTVTVFFTPSEKTLRYTSEGEDTLTRSIPRALFIPVDTIFPVGSPPRSSYPTGAKQPRSAPTVENRGIPDAVDPRRVRSVSAYFEPIPVPSFDFPMPGAIADVTR